MIDTLFGHRKTLHYSHIIRDNLPAWTILWRDVGVLSCYSYWPSRRSVLGQEVASDMVDDEYSVDTSALVPWTLLNRMTV